MKSKTAKEILKSKEPHSRYSNFYEENTIFDAMEEYKNQPSESLEKMLDEKYPLIPGRQGVSDIQYLKDKTAYHLAVKNRKEATEFYNAGKSQALSEHNKLPSYDEMKVEQNSACEFLKRPNAVPVSNDYLLGYLSGFESCFKWIEIYFKSEQADKKWISVTEKMPKFNEEVLVLYHPITPNMGGELNKGIYKRVSPEHISMLPSSSQRKLNEYSGFLVNVVFWMPLPESPKQ